MKKNLFIIFLSFTFGFSYSQEKVTENTMKLIGKSPQASFEDISWIAGHWKAEAFDGEAEEAWLPQFGDSMIGVFKLVVDDNTKFTEMMRVVEKEGSLILQLKHFDKDFVGWEEKDKTIDFPLVKIENNRIYFDGLTFEKVSENNFKTYLAIRYQDGKIEEVLFDYHK